MPFLLRTLKSLQMEAREHTANRMEAINRVMLSFCLFFFLGLVHQKRCHGGLSYERVRRRIFIIAVQKFNPIK